jgi:hypothetical protein
MNTYETIGLLTAIKLNRVQPKFDQILKCQSLPQCITY